MDVPIYSLADLETLPPGQAWEAYRYIAGNFSIVFYQHKADEYIREATIHIANRTDVGQLLQKKLDVIPNTDPASNRRYSIYSDIKSIPAAWAARIMARDLMSEEPYEEGPGDDVLPAGPKQEIAIRGFEEMGLPGIPNTKGRRITDAEIQIWRSWWMANEARIDDLVRQINPQYNPRSLPVSATSTPTATPKQIVIGEYASPPAVSNTPKPTPSPSVTPVAAASARQSDWAIYAIGGLVALGALIAVGWAMRRQ